jgi:hypothetical protein
MSKTLTHRDVARRAYAKASAMADLSIVITDFLESHGIDIDIFYMEGRTADMAREALKMNPPDEVRVAAEEYLIGKV